MSGKDVSDALWDAYGYRYASPMYTKTRTEVEAEFERRGYSTLEDVKKFLTALEFDGWHEGDEEQKILPTVKYLNVYETDRAYGGPEEGGWYYTVGMPLASMPVPIDMVWDECSALLEKMRALVAPHHQDAYVSLDIEMKYAEPFPQNKPHYE